MINNNVLKFQPSRINSFDFRQIVFKYRRSKIYTWKSQGSVKKLTFIVEKEGTLLTGSFEIKMSSKLF